MVYTVIFFGSTRNPKELTEEKLAEACGESLYALVGALDETEAVWNLRVHMEFERQRQEKMLEPKRQAYHEKYPDEILGLHLTYTALSPLAVDSWKAICGRQDVRYKYKLMSGS